MPTTGGGGCVSIQWSVGINRSPWNRLVGRVTFGLVLWYAGYSWHLETMTSCKPSKKRNTKHVRGWGLGGSTHKWDENGQYCTRGPAKGTCDKTVGRLDRETCL